MSIVTNLRYTANLDKGVTMTPITPSFLGGDQDAHRFVIDCYRQNSREAVDLSGAGVTAYFLRADGVTIPLVGETEGNAASVLLPAACYAVQGRFSLVVKLSLDDGTADSINTIFWGEGAVSRSRTDVVIDPDSVIPSLEELLAQIEAMEIATNNANEAADKATQAATDATSTANAAAASAQATAEAAATKAVEIATAKGDEAVQVATDKGNEAVQIATEQVEAQNQAIAQIATDLLTKAPAIECEASGPLVTVTDAAAQPAVQLVTHIEPVQEGEGDPSPDNVRPISGWDKVTAQRARKNLFKVVPGELNGVTLVAYEDYYVLNGTCTLSGLFKAKIGYLPAGTYTLSANNSAHNGITQPIVQIYSATNAESVGANDKIVNSTATGNIKGANDWECRVRISQGAIYDNYIIKPQLEVGSTATAYEPYQGQTLTAELPETIYGGTLDWNIGTAQPDLMPTVFDGDEDWKMYSTANGNGFYIELEGFADSKQQVLSDKLKYIGEFDGGAYFIASANVNECCTLRGIARFYVKSDATTINEFKAILAANPVTVAHSCTTMQPIQLTAQQLSMLRGTNNLWSDTGDTDLVYVADTKLYIDQAIKAALNTTAEE